MNIMSEAFDLNEEIVKWRRDLHKIPEIGMNLPSTCEYVKNRLDEIGVAYTTYESILAYRLFWVIKLGKQLL